MWLSQRFVRRCRVTPRNALLERPRLNGERPAAEGPRVAAPAGGGDAASASGGGAYEQVSSAEASA